MYRCRVDGPLPAWAWSASTWTGSSTEVGARGIPSTHALGRYVLQPAPNDRASRVAGGIGRRTMLLCVVVGTGARRQGPIPRSKRQPTTPRPVVSRITCLDGGPAHTGCHSAARPTCISAARAQQQTNLSRLRAAIARSFARRALRSTATASGDGISRWRPLLAGRRPTCRPFSPTGRGRR